LVEEFRQGAASAAPTCGGPDFPFVAFVASLLPAAKAGKQQWGPAFTGMAEQAAQKVVPATPVAPAFCRLPLQRTALPTGSRRYVSPLRTCSAASEVLPWRIIRRTADSAQQLESA